MLQGFANVNRYDDKHLISNEVTDKTQPPLKAMYNVQSPSRNTDCPSSSKPAMANRLLDWFSVVMADSKHRRQHPKPKGRKTYGIKAAVCEINIIQLTYRNVLKFLYLLTNSAFPFIKNFVVTIAIDSQGSC